MRDASAIARLLAIALLLALSSADMAAKAATLLTEGSTTRIGDATITLLEVRPDERTATIAVAGRIGAVAWSVEHVANSHDMLVVGTAMLPVTRLVAARAGRPGNIEIGEPAGWTDAECVILHDGDAMRLTGAGTGPATEVTVGGIHAAHTASGTIDLSWVDTRPTGDRRYRTMGTGGTDRFGASIATVIAIYPQGDGMRPRALIRLRPAR